MTIEIKQMASMNVRYFLLFNKKRQRIMRIYDLLLSDKEIGSEFYRKR